MCGSKFMEKKQKTLLIFCSISLFAVIFKPLSERKSFGTGEHHFLVRKCENKNSLNCVVCRVKYLPFVLLFVSGQMYFAFGQMPNSCDVMEVFCVLCGVQFAAWTQAIVMWTRETILFVLTCEAIFFARFHLKVVFPVLLLHCFVFCIVLCLQ